MVSLDNQTLLYLIIGCTIVTLLVMHYYVNLVIDKKICKNNKKMVKKVSDEIKDTFKQYIGSRHTEEKQKRSRRHHHHAQRDDSDQDSINDPVGDEMEDMKE
jgi:truncated hemoglobin YjbI